MPAAFGPLRSWNATHAGHGGGGIRTHGPRERTPVFKTGAFNRSATPPGDADCARKLLQTPRPVQPEGFRASARQKTRFVARPGPSVIRRGLLPESPHSIQPYASRQSPGGLKQGLRPFALCNSYGWQSPAFTKMTVVKLLIVDDHPLFRDGLAALLLQ